MVGCLESNAYSYCLRLYTSAFCYIYINAYKCNFGVTRLLCGFSGELGMYMYVFMHMYMYI